MVLSLLLRFASDHVAILFQTAILVGVLHIALTLYRSTHVPAALAHLPRIPILSVVRVCLSTKLDFVGMMFALQDACDRWCVKHGIAQPRPDRQVALAWLFGSWGLITWKPDHIRRIATDIESFPKDPFPEKLLPITHKLMGSNIVFSNGDVWRRHRKIAHPAFSKRWHTDIFADVLRTFVDVLDQRVGTPVDPNAYMQRLTLDALSTAAFGESFNSLRNPHSDLVNTYNQVVNDQLHPVFRFLPFLQLIPIPFIRRMSQSVDKFNAYLHDIIDRRTVQVNALRASGAATPAHDLLAKMIEANLDDEDGSFSQEDLRANLAVFFIAGHDTTASALATSLYLMGMHPAVQKKARQEVLNECGASVSGEYHLPTTEQQARLEYLTLVVKETLRMYPPLPTVLFRRSTTAVELEPGLVLPAGTRVHFDMLCLHRDTSIWGDDAMQFRPERWETMTFDHDDGKDDAGSHYRRDSGVDVLDPTHYNRERRHSHSHGMTGNVPVLPAQHNYSWLPFGAGPRICLGQAFSLMEIRVVLAVILQRYEWRVVGDERALRGELDMSQTNMLHPLNVQLEFTRIAQ